MLRTRDRLVRSGEHFVHSLLGLNADPARRALPPSEGSGGAIAGGPATHGGQGGSMQGERRRLAEVTDEAGGWRRWGPYLADRSWGTVREDYSADGDAWSFLTYEQSRAKAYRWGEDGIAGLSDRYQFLCFAPAFWNGADPHLKERFFGVTPWEGNHGEDAKEWWVHVDNTPTHSFMSLLYRYPQAAFPYARLVEENRARRGQGAEYEILDTGVFDDDRFFEIVVEYAKRSPEEIAIRITACNRGPAAAPLEILPTLWFRNTWAWGPAPLPTPAITLAPSPAGTVCLVADDAAAVISPRLPPSARLGRRWLLATTGPDDAALFTDNETNMPRVYGAGATSRSRHTKDAFHRLVCDGETGAVNPAAEGTKACLRRRFTIPAGGSASVHLLLSDRPPADTLPEGGPGLGALVDAAIAERRSEADAFYAALAPPDAGADERHVQRRALAGLLWSKQTYLFDVAAWLDGDDPAAPPPPGRRAIRNGHWRHLNSHRVLSMPDTWEYPWFAAWDLAFHCVALVLVDPAFAKDQLWLLLFEQFQHPSGQLPAYEWEFSDLNPPVHAWAVWRVYGMEKRRHGRADRPWLERCFHKLLLTFTSWVNKVDREGNNVFEGGFLGLDNISVFDRSRRPEGGATLEQSDATGWMGMFSLAMMRMALELAQENPVYESLASKFLQHYAYIASAMKTMGSRGRSLFDEEDGFFYDVLRHPDGRSAPFRVRSLVGLIPLFAVERLEEAWIAPFREFRWNLEWFLANRPDMTSGVIHRIPRPDGSTTHLLTIVDTPQLRRILARVHDEEEFLSPHGIRSLSRHHTREPFEHEGVRVGYEPAEAESKLKGGNSNWRGPVWFPTSFLLVEALRKLGTAFGPGFTLATPASGGREIGLREMAADIAARLTSLFRLDASGRRPVWGDDPRFRDDPAWRDELLFFEYFHGDTGAGLGASHQTGWTALVANLIDEWRS
ncbi:MAG: MGH1-like glycoside hydrolase domain-containing protein [Planctomycetaceae bacterium]